MPLIVMAPFAAFLIALSSVRTRRSSANLAMFGAVVTLLASLLVGWGLAKRTTPFLATYSYINLPVAVTGPANFQGFGIDIVLRVDHVGIVALIVVELCVIGVLGWHQVMGRSEPGAARFNALMSVLLFGAIGVLVSWDLAELLAFWGVTGAATYLLLAHRWGMDEAALRARVALALPFVTDLSLLCGVAWLYARYGVNNLTTLLPILHTNPGWTERSLVVASILLFVAVAGRLALWPLQSWVTRTAVTAPPAASAVTQAVWSVLAIVVLYRLMPIVVASNAQTVKGLLYGCGAAAIVAPLLALVGNEPRRIVALLGSGATAVGAAVVIHGFQVQGATFAIAGIACVMAVAPARAGAVLAVSAIAAAMRTDDLVEMGNAWTRMRTSALAVLVAAIVMGLSTVGALAFGVSSRSNLGLAMGEAVLLIALGGARIFLGVSIGPLRRRRTFVPDRVREAPSPSLAWPYWLGGAGALLLIASLIHGWLDFLDGKKHPAPTPGAYLLWVVVVLIGFALPVLAYVRDQDGALHVSAWAGIWLRRLTRVTSSSFARFIVAPVSEIAVRLGERWIPAGDGGVGRALDTTGRLAVSGARLPVLPLLILAAVVLTVVVGLVAPGVFR
ncbi:MAG: proton-conducting transporter membrane subunit [Candidatus Dormibacteraceae bacterium]